MYVRRSREQRINAFTRLKQGPNAVCQQLFAILESMPRHHYIDHLAVATIAAEIPAHGRQHAPSSSNNTRSSFAFDSPFPMAATSVRRRVLCMKWKVVRLSVAVGRGGGGRRRGNSTNVSLVLVLNRSDRPIGPIKSSRFVTVPETCLSTCMFVKPLNTPSRVQHPAYSSPCDDAHVEG